MNFGLLSSRGERKLDEEISDFGLLRSLRSPSMTKLPLRQFKTLVTIKRSLVKKSVSSRGGALFSDDEASFTRLKIASPKKQASNDTRRQFGTA